MHSAKENSGFFRKSKKSYSPERSLALEGLLGILYDGDFSGDAVDKGCNILKDKTKKGFFTKLLMGTLERILYLDEIIRIASNRRPKDINRVVLNILRLSVYQIYYMDSVPDSATLNCAQYLCVEKRQRNAKGFVNGVLRNISSNSEEIKSKLNDSLSGSKALSVEYSVPVWIVEYLMESTTIHEVKSLFNNFNKEHFLTLRVNTAVISLEDAYKNLNGAGLYPVIHKGIPAITLSTYVSPDNIPGFNEGHFYVQDASSMRAIAAIGIKPGDRIIDVCAAPGGKGLFAASLAGEKGFVSMRDISEDKVSLIRENISRIATDYDIETLVWDARELDESAREAYDVVICDLPCSGLGTIGNKPEIKYRLKKDDIQDLAKLQQEILQTACYYVKIGGKLMFSTCTIGSRENAQNILDFRLERVRSPEFKICAEVQLLPDGRGSDGFFYCVMERIS